MQTGPDQSRQIQTSSDKSIHVHTCLVRHGLKYELYITWRAGQRYSAERAGRLETGSATRNWYFRPIFHRFGRSHVTTGDKAISRSITVYIKSWKKRRKLWFKNFMTILNVHFFVPCGFIALSKTVKYWPEVHIPCGTSSFQTGNRKCHKELGLPPNISPFWVKPCDHRGQNNKPEHHSLHKKL